MCIFSPLSCSRPRRCSGAGTSVSKPQPRGFRCRISDNKFAPHLARRVPAFVAFECCEGQQVFGAISEPLVEGALDVVALAPPSALRPPPCDRGLSDCAQHALATIHALVEKSPNLVTECDEAADVELGFVSVSAPT